MKRGILLLLFLATLAGCDDPKETVAMLDEAEFQMIEHPDSAKIVLESVEWQSLRSRRARARFALLYSQALDKNAIDVDQDSLAHIATQFYKWHGTDNEKALAYYYRGRVYENANHIDSAIVFFTEAEQHVAQTDNYYLKGLIANAMAKMYLSQRFHTLAKQKYIESADHFKKTNKKQNVLLNYLGIINICSIQLDYNEQEYYLNCSEPIANELKDYSKLLYLARSKATMIIHRDKNYTKALQILRKAINQYAGKITPSNYYPILAKIYTKLNQPDSAFLYAEKWEQSNNTHNKVESFYLQGIIYQSKGQYKNAYKCTLNALEISDSLYYQEKEHIIPELKAKYQNEQLRIQNQYLHLISRYQRYIAFIIVTVLLIIVFWLIMRHRYKMRKQVQEIAEYRDTISRIKNDYETLQELYRHHAIPMGIDAERTNRRIEFLKQLLDIMTKFSHDKVKLHQKIEELLTNSSDNGRKGRHELFLIFQDIIDMQCPGIINHLTAQYPQLSNQDLTLYCMVCLDISKASVCWLLNCQLKTYYNYRNILRNKLGIAHDDRTIYDHFRQLCKDFHEMQILK